MPSPVKRHQPPSARIVVFIIVGNPANFIESKKLICIRAPDLMNVDMTTYIGEEFFK